MKIAVTSEGNKIYQHFGHCPGFSIFEVEGQEIKSKEYLAANGVGHSALAVLLDGNDVDILICGGLGGCARQALGDAGIKILPGVRGDVDAAVKAYLDGTLEHDPDYTCDHHGHEHGEGHQCGQHHGHGEGHQYGHHHGDGEKPGRYHFVFGKNE